MASHPDAGSRATTAGEVGRASDYVPALDGVRAIAIAGVFLLHLDRAHFPGGAFGVDVFFVLSAFLITGILLREREQSGGVDFKAFYLRRAFRLLPALIVWIVLFAVPTALAQHQTAKIPWSAGGALFYFSDFLEGWTHTVGSAFDQSWSLSVEEQFYAVWPALLLVGLTVLRHRGLKAILGVIVVASLVSSLFINSYFLPTGHLLAFALGAWAAYQEHSGLDPRLQRLLRTPFPAPAAGTVFAVALVLSPGPRAGHILAIAVDISAALLILALTLPPAGTTLPSRPAGTLLPLRPVGTAARALGSRPVAWVGARSYGVYLYGLTIMQLIPVATGLHLRTAAPLDVASTLVVAGLSYRLVEAPLRRRGRTWLEGKYPPDVRPAAGRPAAAV